MANESEMIKVVLGQGSVRLIKKKKGCEVSIRMKKQNRTRNPFQKCLSSSEVT